VLTAMVESVADALRLPYVPLVVGGDSTSPRVERGIAPARPLELPLVFGGAPVGRLLLAPRGVGERFGDADLRLLTDIGRSVSGAVHALALNDHLQESRERLVLAREEERRRVRRDLHDGLGPSLAAVTLQIDGLRRTLPVEVAAGCDEAFAEVKSEVTSCVAEVRRLVSGLRPPALDELGLAKAVAQQARLLTGSGCLVELDIALPRDLPAALEVAAFRIVSEALHNVARHAAADRVLVRVADGTDGLHLEVRDDGRGLGPVPNPRSGTGVGLASMRERAEELGGRLTVEPAEGAGTLVRALLPAHVL
jgi:signal transduction histidine kinase